MAEESRQTAYHEAGHMVAAWELGLNVLGATIIPDPEEGYAGRVKVPVEDRVRYADWVKSEQEYLYAHLVMRYAGIEAADTYVGAPMPELNIDLGGFAHPGNDYRNMAQLMIEVAGPDEQEQSETAQLVEDYAKLLVSTRWSQIEEVA